MGLKSRSNSARGRIQHGEGVGRDVISRYLDGRLPTSKIETALATIKGSDLHLVLINKVGSRILRVAVDQLHWVQTRHQAGCR